MPKRKNNSDDYDYLRKKLKKLERKMRRTKKRRTIESDRESGSDRSPVRLSDIEDGQHVVLTEQDLTVHAEPDGRVISPTQATATIEELPLPQITESAPSNIQTESVEIDSEILAILGDDPTQIKGFGKEINNDLAIRLQHYATTGLTVENRKQLTDRYLLPGNYKLINAPALNAEKKAAITEFTLKRDKAIEAKQRLLSTAISSLGEAITKLLSSKEKNNDLLKILMDTGRLLCDCQYSESFTRRAFILSTLKKDMRSQLQSTKVDETLFGQNLPEALKSAKAINKSVADLIQKPAAPVKPSTSRPLTLQSPKNWKGAVPNRRQPGPVHRTTKPAAAKNRQPPASRTSSHQRQQQNYRR